MGKIPIGSKYLKNLDVHNLLSIIQVPVAYYTVDGLKSTFLYNNAGKDYREYLKKRKALGLDPEKIPFRIISAIGSFMSFRGGLGF